MIDRDDRNAFMDLVDERVLDDFLTQVYGHDAMETVTLDELELTKVELQFLVDAAIDGHNTARNDGDLFQAIMHYRLLQKLIVLDSDIEEMHEEAQEQMQNPLMAMFGGDLGP